MEFFGLIVVFFEIEMEEEVLELVNDIEYGLLLVVFSVDFGMVMCIVRGIEMGVVYINSMSVYDELGMLYGGVKVSGYGWFNVDVGLSEWMRMKILMFFV